MERSEFKLKETLEIELLENEEEDLSIQINRMKSKLKKAKESERKALIKIKTSSFNAAQRIGIETYLASLTKAELSLLSNYQDEIFKALSDKITKILVKLDSDNEANEAVVEEQPNDEQ